MTPAQLCEVTRLHQTEGISRKEARARVERKIAEARARIAARPVPRAIDPALLAACRGGCPDYSQVGVGERCYRGLNRPEAGGCERKALEQWQERILCLRPLCERQQAITSPTPVDVGGLISPASQGRIQIEITNACAGHEHAARCSNCSRFCPHIARPFFMPPDTFRAAVDSMAGYRGMLGIMGGEPTLHPQFRELILYYRERWAGVVNQTHGRRPIADFAEYHAGHWSKTTGQRSGLWSSVGAGYARHYELIQDTFGYQCLNTHNNRAAHQALLVTRRELGVADADWVRLRDNCWVQRLWSSSITPRGCYPCEIMAALDTLYAPIGDEERAKLGIPPAGGWPIESGWWRRTPAEFGRMLDWCELCAAPLATPKRLATEDLQDISLWHLERMRLIDSPAIKAGRIVVLDSAAARNVTAPESKPSNWYMPADDEPRRASGRDALLRVKRIEGLLVSVDCGDHLRRTLARNAKHFDRMVVVTASHDAESREVARANGADVVVSDECYRDGAAFNKGRMLNAGLEYLKPDGWIVLHDADVFLPPNLGDDLRRLILNPGCLYYTKRHHLPPDVTEPDWARLTDYELLDPHGNNAPWGYFQLFNVRASSIARPFRLPECFCSAGSIDHWTMAKWPRDKHISLADWSGDHRFDVLHLWHGYLANRWNGYRANGRKWKYAGQSNIASEGSLRASWPSPCLVRRTNLHTCQQEESHWDGRRLDPGWITDHEPTIHEYSVRSLDDDAEQP